MAHAAAVLPRARGLIAALAALALVALLLLPSPWRGVLTDLSPIASADLQLDAALRNDVGAPDAGVLVAVSAGDEASVLAGAEAAGRRLDALVHAGALAGYDSPARFLPSPATQRARLAALPDAATLNERLAAATVGGALPATRLQPFVDDVQAARRAIPFDRAALDGTPLATAVDALLLRGDSTRPWRALLNLQPAAGRPIDAAQVRAAIAGVPGAQLVAISAELGALYDRYLRQAMWQAGLGALAVVALLAVHLRDARRLARVLQPLAAATLVVLAALAASGAALGILHLVGLLLTIAIGSNYALFFDHLRRRDAVDADTLASLVLANLTTVISFGLLATSGIPVLKAVGEVVAPGTMLCLIFSAAFVGRRPVGEAYGKLRAP
jgi:predicted exporter